MKTFWSLEEVESAGLSPPVYAAVHRVLKNLIDAYAKHGEVYDPEDDGYTILIEGGEPDAEIGAEVGYSLRGRRHGKHHGCAIVQLVQLERNT